ncbi:hypothetical protein CLV81_3364 [Flagellimonas meridianipacifica]|uniref:Uncharacterized protein n=1 Tax=Flagellimonas meridianipacifica TaxID=1080225 RepID=A0A2T0MBT0_9FLAO|nr:hypothetical protein CLV81_3364 [Allomuricauda pacifica]
MPRIELKTEIEARKEIIFDLSRSSSDLTNKEEALKRIS